MDSSPTKVTQTSATENTHSTSNMSSDNQYAMSTNAQSPNNVGLYGSASQAQTFMTGATMPLETQYVQTGDNSEQVVFPEENTAASLMDIAKELFGENSTTTFQTQDNTFQVQDTTFNNLSQDNNLGFPDQTSVYEGLNLNKAAGGYQTPHFNPNDLTQDNASGLQSPNFSRVRAQSKRPASRASTSNGIRPELDTPVPQASTNNGVRRQIKKAVSRLSAGSHRQSTQNNGYVNGFGFQNEMGYPSVASINPNDPKRFDAYNMQHFSASGPSTQHISQPQQYNTVNTNISSQNFGPVVTDNGYFSRNQNQNQFVGNQQQFITQNETARNGTAQNNVGLGENAIKNSPTYKALQKQAIRLYNLVNQSRLQLAASENDKKTVLKALEDHKAQLMQYQINVKEWLERHRNQNMAQRQETSTLEEENRQLRAALANAGIEFQFQQPVLDANTTNVPAQVGGQKRKAPDADDTIDLTRTNDASSPAPIITAVNSAEQTASSSPENGSASDSTATPAADTTAATTPVDNTNGPPPPKKRKTSIPDWLKTITRQPQLMAHLGMVDMEESRELQSKANVQMHSERIHKEISKNQAKQLEKEEAEAKEMARKEEEKQKAAKKRANESEAQRKAREEKEQREKREKEERAQRIAEAKARNDEDKKRRKAEAAKKKREEKKARDHQLLREEQERIAEFDRKRLEEELEEEAKEFEDLLSGELTAEEEASIAGAGAYDPNEVEELPEYQPRPYHDDEESEVSEEE